MLQLVPRPREDAPPPPPSSPWGDWLVTNIGNVDRVVPLCHGAFLVSALFSADPVKAFAAPVVTLVGLVALRRGIAEAKLPAVVLGLVCMLGAGSSLILLSLNDARLAGLAVVFALLAGIEYLARGLELLREGDRQRLVLAIARTYGTMTDSVAEATLLVAERIDDLSKTEVQSMLARSRRKIPLPSGTVFHVTTDADVEDFTHADLAAYVEETEVPFRTFLEPIARFYLIGAVTAAIIHTL